MGLLCHECSAWVDSAEADGLCEACRGAKEAAPKREDVKPSQKKRPSFWVSDEELASPKPEVEVWNPSDQSSSLMDLQMIVQESGGGAARPSRRIDDDLVRLDAPVFVSVEPPAPEPPPDLGDTASDGVALDSVIPSPHAAASEEAEPAPIPPRRASGRALAMKLVPWAGAGAAALVCAVWLVSRGDHDPPAPDPRATLEAATQAAPQATPEPAPVPVAAPEPAAPAAAPVAAPEPAAPEPIPAAAHPEAPPAEATRPAVAAPPQPAAAHHPFNRAAAITALASAASRAGGCKKPGDPKGLARVTVTFAPNGRASQVQVAPPFAGTRTGACAAAAFRGATVPAFEGQPVPVSKGVSMK